MTFVAIALIASATFALWLLRRRVKPLSDGHQSEIHPGTLAVVVEDSEISEVEDPASCSPSMQAKHGGTDSSGAAPIDEPIAVRETTDTTLSEKAPDSTPAYQTESLVHAESSVATVLDADPAESSGQWARENSGHLYSPASSETFLEGANAAAENGKSHINSHDLRDHAVSAAGSTLQAECITPDGAISTSTTYAASGETPQVDTGGRVDRVEESRDENIERIPKRYRPPAQRLPRQGNARNLNQETRAVATEAALEIRLRLTFDRFGFCTIGLLPVRTSDLDNEITVESGGISLPLVAQEDWYQDIPVGNLVGRLREGLELRGRLADQRYVRWALPGRDIFVLASDPRASGFVSTSRLALQRSHVVLCVADLYRQVEAILNEAGCEGFTKLDESHGVPAGWAGIRDVTPTRPVPLVGSDPFYPIKPAADIDIDLEGGVRLRHSVWLSGFPPKVKVYGLPTPDVKILLDGHEVRPSADGSITANGFDFPGQHSVYCEGLSCSRTYSIEEPPASWDAWAAYRFRKAVICGPLVQVSDVACTERPFVGPMSNPLLIGAEPGQIFRCSSRGVALWKGLVPFKVVWALPAQPLLCDKKTARIIQCAEAPVSRPAARTKLDFNWCSAILDASRKGLQIENGSPKSKAQWGEYKKIARNIRRGRR